MSRQKAEWVWNWAKCRDWTGKKGGSIFRRNTECTFLPQPTQHFWKLSHNTCSHKTCKHTCTHTNTHTYTHIHMHKHTHAYTHLYMIAQALSCSLILSLSLSLFHTPTLTCTHNHTHTLTCMHTHKNTDMNTCTHSKDTFALTTLLPRSLSYTQSYTPQF